MRIFAGSFSSVGATKKTWPSNRSCADDRFPRPFGHADDAAFRPSAGFPQVISTFTLSPFIAEPVSAGGNEDVAVDAGDFL